MLAPFITFLVLLGVLVTLACNVGLTGMFLKSPPKGDRAMGLIVPFIGLLGAAVVITLASVLASLQIGSTALGMMHASPAISGLLTVVVTLGVMIAAFMALAMWAEPTLLSSSLQFIKPLIGLLAGVAGPAALGATLIAGVWMTPQWCSEHHQWNAAFRASCGALAALALAGYVLGGVTFVRPLIMRMSASRAAVAKMSPAERAAGERFRTTPVEQLLSEELDALPSDAPLSEVVRYFVGSPKKLTDRCREMLVQRALGAPDVDRELVEAMRARMYSDRWGAAEFVRYAAPEYVASHHDAWAKAVAAGIYETAEAMMTRPAWLSETFDQNPEPLELVRSLLAAAERFEGDAGVRDALRKMARAVNELKRDKKQEKLESVMKNAGHPVPADDLQTFVMEIARFPEALCDLLKAEVRAGNQILEITGTPPAPPAGLYARLARPVSTRPRKSFDDVQFFERNSSSYSGEFADADRMYFVIEPPRPPEPAPDMDAIRSKLDAAERASNADRFKHGW